MGFWLTGKLGRAWVVHGIWWWASWAVHGIVHVVVHGMVHGWVVVVVMLDDTIL